MKFKLTLPPGYASIVMEMIQNGDLKDVQSAYMEEDVGEAEYNIEQYSEFNTFSVEIDRQKLWDNRLVALEHLFGPQDETVFHSLIPFDVGGVADVLVFKQHLDGVVYITADLIGSQEQLTSELGNYELMICFRGDSEVGPNLISKLAVYTCEDRLKPGDFMNIERAAPVGSNVSAFLFLKYADLEVLDQRAGVLLCLGITRDELELCQLGRRDELVRKLKRKNVFPFTEWRRKSVLTD